MFKKPKKEEKDKKKSDKKEKKDKKLSSSGKTKGPPTDLPPPAPAPTPESRRADSLSGLSESESVAVAPVDVPEEEGIIFGSERDASGRPSIKGATLEKLVERLTHTHTDQKYIQTFMLTFRSFTTPLEFLSLLKRRFYLEQQPGQSNEEFETSLRFVRTRTTNVIKHWIQKSFFDFQEDEQLRNEILHFLNNDFLTHVEPAARQLLKLFEKQLNGETGDRERETIHGKKAPAPHLPRNLSHKSLNFRDFHPEEIARQLTLIEYSLYKLVKPWECLNQAWAKQDKEIKSPNILKMIDQFNNTSKWVTTEICKAADLRERTIVLQQMIEIAEYCKALKNFNAMMEVISGVNSASVFRLKQTWAGLPKKHLASYEEMQNLMSSDQSYKNFRAFLHSVNPPCIPYLGMYLTDLTFIEEGNQNFLQPSGAINFFKRQKLSEVIAEIQIYQNEPYNLEPVKFIQDFLLNAECLPEEQCYKMSLRREKRGGVVVSEDQQEDDEDDEPFGEMQKVEGYHFDEPDTDSNIKLEKTDSLLAEASFVPIKGATIIKLVERLTYHKYQDMEYGWAFLMTYRNFSTPHDFLDLLIIRYNMPFPKNPSKQQLTKFTSSRLIPIRLRIFNVLKNWITEYAVDFREDPTLYAKLMGFIERCKEDVKHSLDKPAANLQTLAEKKVAEEPPAESLQLLGSQYSPDNPDLGKITEYDDEGMAEQLTLFDFNLFKTILPRECLATSWEDGSAVHIHYERYNFDLMKRWAATQIVMEKDIQKRYLVLSHLVKIADNLLQIRNFNCFVAIINGIMMISSGLATTLDWVPTPISEKYISFQALVKTPKNLLSKEKAEDGVMLQTIPYVEAYLRRLNQFHDTFPDFIDSASSIINFEKRKKFYEVYKECFEKHKNNPFPFRLDETFQNYLLHVPIYEEEDIKRLAKSFPLEGPPSQRPTIHDLPAATRFPRDHEEKLNTTQDQPEEIPEEDSSSENGTAQPEDQTASQIKSAILTVLGEDRELAQDILNNVRSAVTTEILQDFRDYAANMKDELSLLHSQFGILKPELGWEAAERIVRRKFPGSTVDVWRCFDADGFVYGWQEEVGLFVVESQQLVLLSVRVDEAFISSALRIAGLYVTDRSISDEDSQNLQVYILTSQCSDSTRAAAVSQGIAILDF